MSKFGLWTTDNASEVEIKAAIDLAWEDLRMDWLGLEEVLVTTLKSSQINDKCKITLIKDAINAFTKRGHFANDEG